MREQQQEEPGPFGDDDADKALLARSVGGDADAFRALYDKYYHPLLRFIYRITGQLELAQEGVNDVMLVVWKNGSSFGGRSRVGTWIMGIAYRKALKMLDKSRRWSDRFRTWGDDADELPDPSPEHTVDVDLEDLIERGMERLPAKQRAVVELTYYYGYSYAEIAEIAGCPVNTVKTRMFHARERLKQSLPPLARDELIK